MVNYSQVNSQGHFRVASLYTDEALRLCGFIMLKESFFG